MTRKAARVHVAVVGALLVVTACGSGGSSGGPGVAQLGPPGAAASSSPGAAGSGGASAVAYSACMRHHGVPNYPDPTSSNPVIKVTPQQLAVSGTELKLAQHDCERLLPITGDNTDQQQELQCAETGDCPAAVVTQWMDGLRSLARCLRSHGQPRWPDPVVTSLGGHPASPHFLYDQAGIDHHSDTVLKEVNACVQITRFDGLPLP